MVQAALEKVYAAVFIDAIMVKIATGRSTTGRSTPRPVDLGSPGHPGMWAGEERQSANFGWQCSPTCAIDGVKDIFFLVCDGLKGLPTACPRAFPLYSAIIHLIRNTFRYASRKYWDKISVDLKPIYTAASAAEARLRTRRFAE